MSNQKDLSKYCDCMEEIKKRVYIIDYFLLNPSVHKTMSMFTDIEFLCLQFRKIFELIAFSSLTAHRKEYEEKRKSYATDWNFTKILESIRKINPKYYPEPKICSFSNGKLSHLQQRTEGFLLEVDLESVFQETQDFLHAWNPYSGKNIDLDTFVQKMKIWIQEIKTLLNQHVIWLFPGKNGVLVFVEFMNPDQKVYAVIFEETT